MDADSAPKRRSHGSRGRPRGFAALSAGAIVLVCIALAAPVSAFVSKNTHGVVVRKLSSGSSTASCPKGEHVAFGGVVAQYHVPPTSGALVFPTGMRRTANNKWSVYGVNGSGTVGGRLTAAVYCDRGTVPRIVSKNAALPGLGIATATATCPAGTVVVGGGYNSAATTKHIELVARLQRSTSTSWVVTMINVETAPTTITAIAYCAPGAAPKQITAAATLGAGKGGTAHASCPGSTKLLFGGVLGTTRQSGAHFAAVAPFSFTAATTSQWVVTGYNAGDISGALDAFAYCR